MNKLIINTIKIYKKSLSPALEHLFGKGCIYTPTCSQYAIDSLKKYPLKKALRMSFKRFISCQNINPSTKSYFDPVK